jgi:Fur family ferric uptake transcriptional regulator
MRLSSGAGEFEERVRSRLRENDVRFTAGRARVVRLIEAAGGPRSAAELHAIVRDDVPLSTLYRTLTVLSEAGVLDRSHGPEGVALFELAEWLRGHHHHLVCSECGSVEDVDVGTDDEAALGALADRVASSQGFLARGHRIDVEGICRRCAA